MKKKPMIGYERSIDLIRKMNLTNCGLKLKSKEQSLEFMLEQYEQYRLNGRANEKAAKLLKITIDACLHE